MLDNLLDLVQPSKLIFFALDGVAPQAKMNQQRKRRFLVKHTKRLDDAGCSASSFDRNAITPGTLFMLELGIFLQNYCRNLSESERWKHITIILSDSSVPG